MKVYHFTHELPEASGVATFVRELSAALGAEGVESHILTKVPETNEEALIPDVVHIHGMWLGFYHRAVMWAKMNGVPIVWSTHGMTAPWSMKHKWWKKCLPWYLYQKRDLKRAALIHSTTELEAGWNRHWGAKRQVIIPLGTHLPVANEVEGCRLKVEGEGRSEKVILFVGRVYPVKGLMNVVRAAKDLKGAGVKFRIVGPDQAGHMAELKREADKLGVGEMFEWVGPKYGEELSAEYDKCDALILPSFTENFGATVVDALAHGRPALASTKTAWKVLEDERCGWWVDNSPECLARTFLSISRMSKGKLIEMGERGRKLVEEKYTWQAVARGMKEEYEKIG